jgi:hypothetical protein
VPIDSQEKRDLGTKTAVRRWEESVVAKHEIWRTYKTIKKNYKIAVANVQLVKNNLKHAESKLNKEEKAAALSPKDASARAKVAEAKKLTEVIEKQLGDAKLQKNKVEDELKVAQAKARESSITCAKSKAYAEREFRKQVVSNNQICNVCSLGKTKISKRRQEIDTAVKSELREKAARQAEKRTGKLDDNAGPSIKRKIRVGRTEKMDDVHKSARATADRVRKDREKQHAE